MKQVRRRLAALVLPLFLWCAGCSSVNTNTEALLVPPRAQGEEQDIQAALEDYIASAYGDSGAYKLKYPRAGEYRTAFIVEDFDSDGLQEAIAFYTSEKESGTVHLNLLRQVDDEWRSVSDLPSDSSDVEQVAITDTNGDGSKELFIGWSLYNSRDSQLSIYELEAEDLVERYSTMYSYMLVGDFTGSGRNDVLLLRTNGADYQTTARLISSQNGAMVERGSVPLDGYIQQFGNATISRLTDTVTGVYIDCQKESGTLITELIYWDGEQLVAPFYTAADNATTLTARESGIPSMDVDGDGRVEWPQSSRLPGAETAAASEVTMWLTRWYTYRYETQSVESKFYSLVNLNDGYYLLLDDAWIGQFTASYDAIDRSLSVQAVSGNVIGEELLEIRVAETGETGTEPGREYRQMTLKGSPLVYEVWYAQEGGLQLNMEELMYRFTPLPSVLD